MIDIWDSIEADFQRDYGIDLSIELEKMTWRRFETLLHNISPYGAVSMRLEEAGKKEKLKQEDEKLQADGFFRSIASLKA